MILNVQQIWTRYLPDTIRERKREKKKQIKFIIQIILLSIERATRSRNLFKIGHTHNVLFQSVRDMISEVLVLQSLWYGLTFDTTISGGRSTSEIRGTSRCIAFYGAFYSGVVPDHRSSLLPSSLRSASPTLLSIRAVSFRRKGGSSSGAGSWPDIVCHTLASTPTLHLLYSPPFARCTLVNPRFIMRRI